jgi:single-strand DNA-binding protein
VSMQAAIYGRLGKDPAVTQTANDKPMARTSVAVEVTAHNAEQEETVWISILAFGHQAEALGRCTKGDMISASGRMTLARWKDRQTGDERTGWSMVADSIISARTVRHSGGRREPPSQESRGETERDRSAQV